jgi:hypothetical protein
MDVHVSPDALLELREFLGSFQVRCGRPDGAETLERYMTALLQRFPIRTAIPSPKPSQARANSACKSSLRTCRGMRRTLTASECRT